jgi:hypothetical protein
MSATVSATMTAVNQNAHQRAQRISAARAVNGVLEPPLHLHLAARVGQAHPGLRRGDQLSVAQRCQLVDFPLRRHQPLPRLHVACALTALHPVL